MEACTSLVEFRCQPEEITNPVLNKTIQQNITDVMFTYEFKVVHDFTTDLGPGRGFFLQFLNSRDDHATVRAHQSGLVILDIVEFVENFDQRKFTTETVAELENKISKLLKNNFTKSLPAIRRGNAVEVYFPTADKKLIEYDFDKLVFEETSPYQSVKIFHSNQFGNMLILDDDPNLAESDLLYTQAITGNGKEDYRGKTVLILGGGDGGILHELKKHEPAYITMVEIDEVVLNAARKYLRGICHDSLDQLEGANYKVIVEDCVPILQAFVDEGRTFDFVINDLTAIPVTLEDVGDHWDFLRLILNLSMKVLHPKGKYYTQGNGANMKNALKMYEVQLAKLSHPVEFETKNVFVPSYHELWVFYEIWKKRC